MFVRGNAWGVAWGMNFDEMPQLLVAIVILFIDEYHEACGPCGTISPRSHSYMTPVKGGSPFVAELTT